MKTNFKLLLICFFLSWMTGLNAQILNIEDRRIQKEDTSGWFGHLDLGFSLINNSRQIISLKGLVRIDYLKGRHLFLSLSSYNYVRAAGSTFVNAGYQHFRYNYKVNPLLTLEAFVQGQNNSRINLDFRGLAGFGPRFSFLKKGKFKTFIGLSYMYEYEEEFDPDRINRGSRMSSYLSLNFRPIENLRISNTTYYQPLITDFGNLRLSSQTALVLTITSKLKFTSKFNITYDADVPEGVVNTISSFINGIRWEF